MADFRKAFETGRKVVRNRENHGVLMGLATVTAVGIVQDLYQHRYMSAIVHPAITSVIFLWFAWPSIKPKD